jgi:hypothetical protein
MAYWPDWVLEFCVRLLVLQREGHSLISAAQAINTERVIGQIERVITTPSPAQLIRDKMLRVEDREISLMDAIRGVLGAEVRRLTGNEALLRHLQQELATETALDLAINLLFQGYNMVLCLDENGAQFVPDFLLGSLFNHETGSHPMVAVPILPAVRRLLPGLVADQAWQPRVFPAPKVWIQEGDARVEYPFFRVGPLGFEIARELGITVGSQEPSPGRGGRRGSKS